MIATAMLDEGTAMRAKRLVEATCVAYGAQVKQVVAPRAKRGYRYQAPEFVEARRVAMYLVRLELKLSYPAIGRMFHVDHTIAMDACREISRGKSRRAEMVIDGVLFSSSSRMTGHA